MIVAVAMTFVITTGGIDLSVGSILALVNALAAISLAAGVPWPAVVVLMLLTGAVIGVVQGYFVAYEGIPPFIVTLAGLSMIRGLALLLTRGYSIPIDPESPFNEIGRGWVRRRAASRHSRRAGSHRRLHRLQRDHLRPLRHRRRRQCRGGPPGRRQHAPRHCSPSM